MNFHLFILYILINIYLLNLNEYKRISRTSLNVMFSLQNVVTKKFSFQKFPRDLHAKDTQCSETYGKTIFRFLNKFRLEKFSFQVSRTLSKKIYFLSLKTKISMKSLVLLRFCSKKTKKKFPCKIYFLIIYFLKSSETHFDLVTSKT